MSFVVSIVFLEKLTLFKVSLHTFSIHCFISSTIKHFEDQVISSVSIKLPFTAASSFASTPVNIFFWIKGRLPFKFLYLLVDPLGRLGYLALCLVSKCRHFPLAQPPPLYKEVIQLTLIDHKRVYALQHKLPCLCFDLPFTGHFARLLQSTLPTTTTWSECHCPKQPFDIQMLTSVFWHLVARHPRRTDNMLLVHTFYGLLYLFFLQVLTGNIMRCQARFSLQA